MPQTRCVAPVPFTSEDDHPRRRIPALLACVLLVACVAAGPAAARPAAASGAQDRPVSHDPVSGDLNGDGAARVVAVGDSIMEGAAPRIDEAFRGLGYEVAVDTAVSRSTLAGADLVRFYTAMGADAVVVMLGANDAGDPEALRSRVRAVIDAAQGAPLLFWMTIPEVRDYYPAANEVLRQEMSTRPGGSVLEWSPLAAAPGVTAGDGLHLKPAGVETMTGFVVASVVGAIQEAEAADNDERSHDGAAGGSGDDSDSTGASDGREHDAMRRASASVGRPMSFFGEPAWVTVAILVSAVSACCGLGVVLWSSRRARGRSTQT